MNKIKLLKITAAVFWGLGTFFSTAANAEILAMLNYESKPGHAHPREGIAIMDVDPDSKNFGKILTDIPLPVGVVAHHIFYNHDQSKAYVTALGNNPLQVMSMKHPPYRLQTVPVPACQVSEDMVFSKDHKTWYLTCMGSSNVIVGDAQTDTVRKVIDAPVNQDNKPFILYPHGIGLQEDIDRLIVTSTVRPSDLGAPGETVTVLEARSGQVLSTHKLSDKPSPSGVAPVEAVFLPRSKPAMAYINTMFGNQLWTATWNSAAKTFKFAAVHDFATEKQSVPLEIYFNQARNRLYVTTALPGALTIFDIHNPAQPKLLKTIPTAGGAHHVVFSPDEHYAFVQNSFLNLPEMSDGSITVIDLHTMERKTTLDTFKKQGLNPNCILMLPPWHQDSSH